MSGLGLLGRISGEVLLYLLKKRSALRDEIYSVFRISPEVLDQIVSEYEEFLRVEPAEIGVREPLKLALALLDMGVEPTRVAEHISWRDFELLASKVFAEHGYEVIEGLRWTRFANFEIDVVAIAPSSRTAILVDCKHWNTNAQSRLRQACERHLERARKFLASISWLSPRYPQLERMKSALPLIITLFTPSVRVHKNVLVISIRELNEFLKNVHYVLDQFGIAPISV